MTKATFGKSLRKDFFLEPQYVPVNHGSFGVYPKAIRPLLHELQDKAEAHPDRWNRFEMKPIIRANLDRLSKMINCDADDLVFVPNASQGINTVLRSFPFKAGDKILCYQTTYASVDKTLKFLKDQYQVELVYVELNYPLEDAEVIQLTKEAIEKEQAKGSKFRMAVIDAISSLPGVRLPFEALTKLVKEHGILSLIDAAHAVGHIELNLRELDPDYFISNCHKWLFTPRGCSILYVPKRNQGFIHPTSINWAYTYHTEADDVSSYHLEHAPNTIDTSPYMCVDAAIQYRESIGGEDAIREYCHDMAVRGGALVAEILGTRVMENSTKTLTANMVNVELPTIKSSKTDSEIADYYLEKLIYDHNTMASVYKNNNTWWVRLCGQVYVDLDDFKAAGEALLAISKQINQES